MTGQVGNNNQTRPESSFPSVNTMREHIREIYRLPEADILQPFGIKAYPAHLSLTIPNPAIPRRTLPCLNKPHRAIPPKKKRTRLPAPFSCLPLPVFLSAFVAIADDIYVSKSPKPVRQARTYLIGQEGRCQGTSYKSSQCAGYIHPSYSPRIPKSLRENKPPGEKHGVIFEL